MSNFNSLIRGVAVAAAVLASTALAQAPANDTCAGAEVLTVGTAPVTSSTATRLDLAAAVVETTMSCTSSVKNSVWYQFTAPVTGPYRVETCGPATNYDTVLAVYSGTSCGGLTAVTSGCNDTGTSCTSGASSVNLTLTAGTIYYVQVAVYSTVTLTATLTHALTVTPPQPAPVNDTCAGATPLVPNGGTVVVSPVSRTAAATSAVEEPFTCLTTPTLANSSVWYSITPTVTGAYRMESCSATAPGNTVSDTVLALYTGTCGSMTTAACNNDTCASRSSITATLNAGTTYYLQLAKNGSTVPAMGSDFLQLSVVQIVNGPADICSTSPSLNLNEPLTVSTTAAADGGYSIAQNNAQTDGGGFFGVGQTSSTAPGRDVAYQFRAPTAGRYSFRAGVPSASVDTVLFLTDSCIPASGINFGTYGPPQCIAAANRTSGTSQEETSCVTLGANQTVFVWVDESSASTAGSTLTLEVTPCTQEREPNDTVATTSDLSCVTTGSMSTTTDVDFFALGAPPAGSRVFAMAEAAAANSTDFDMRVTTATNTLEYDDANAASFFGGSAPVIAGTPLTGLPAYLRVSYFSATAAEPYVLYSTIQTGAPTPEVEPNSTLATATSSSTNYFVGSITDGGTDVDTYSFTAVAGQLIFAALDSVPDKTDAGVGSFNYALTLVDSSDAVILTSDDGATSVTLTPTGGSLTASTPIFPADALVYRARSSGTYGIRITKTSGANANPYLLSISVGCTDVAPTLASLTPVSGTPSGGQLITLTGSNFNERSVVRFGSAIASIASVTPTQIVVLSPLNSSGPVAVSVTNGVGLSSSIDPGFTYDDPPGVPPNLTAIAPNFGPVDGGTAVTLTGTVFRVDAGVFFAVGANVVPALNVTVVNSTRITATTPTQLEGLADVQVINYDGLTSTLTGGFRFEGPPVVANITPNTGLTSGGLTITLNGRNFRAGTTVRIGGTLATAVTPAADGLSLTAVTPSSAVNGPVDVIVRTTDGQDATVTGGFIYAYPAPTITSVTPNRGALTGGQLITLAGTGFQTGATVTVGGTPATSVTRVSLTQVTARTPPGTAGPADVTLTNSDAQSVTLTSGYTYQGPPVITSITPNSGLTSGGLTITIAGVALRAGATVRFGATAGTNVVVAADELSLTVTTPAVTLDGPVDVTVLNTDGQQVVSTRGFTYIFPAPTIASITPSFGFGRGGTPITITGTGFQANPTVRIGGAPATGVSRTSLTQITALTPQGTGTVDVVVANADMQSATLAGGFRYVQAPTITSVSPANGPAQGGTRITLTGQNFQPGTITVVRIGGVPAFGAMAVSDTSITATTNAGTPGPADVEVTNADTQVGTLADGFTYDGAPTMLSLSPTSGTTAGGTVVTLTGSGFQANAAVTFGTVASPMVTVISSMQLTAVTPATPVGVVTVTVRNPDNQTASLDRSFRFVAPPTLTTAVPDTGDVSGGTVVRLTGTGFNTSTTVTFGGAAAMQVSLVSATELDAVTPKHLPGAVDVVVSTDGAIATLTGGFTYTRSAPSLVAVAPVSGPIAGGTLLTLSGTGFAAGANITIGGTAATDVVIVSDVLARAVVPAHAAGKVDVVFTNDDNQTSTLSGAFTYVAPPTNNTGAVTDGGDGSIGQEPVGGGGGAGGVSCGCSSFDGSMFSMAGFGLLMVLSRRRRRS